MPLLITDRFSNIPKSGLLLMNDNMIMQLNTPRHDNLS